MKHASVAGLARAASLLCPLVMGLAAGTGGCDQPPATTDETAAVTTTTQAPLSAAGAVLTQHNNAARTGAYTAETTLTPTNVNAAQFGVIYRRRVVGNIVTQPLYAPGLVLASGATVNAAIVATNDNHIFAFDADSGDPDEGKGLLWSTFLGATDAHVNFCNEVQWLQGITSTPVIDPATNSLYVVARLVVGGVVQHRLHKIDLATGNIGTLADIGGSSAGLSFDPVQHVNRPGLLLMNGNVYVGFATRQCDAIPYQGWVFAYNASTLVNTAVFTTASSLRAGTTANHAMAGIWQSGAGLVGDGTSVYFNTGNIDQPMNGSGAPGTPNGSNYSNSVMRVSGTTLAVTNQFQDPHDATLNCGDTDLAAGGPMLLPGSTIISGGKEGVLHLLDLALAPITSFQATRDSYHDNAAAPRCYFAGGPGATATGHPRCFDEPRNSFGAGFPAQNCRLDPSDYGWSERLGPNIHATPAFLQDTSTSGLVFTLGEKDFLRAYRYNISSHTIAAAGQNADIHAPYGMPGGFLSVSSNGTSNGLVWALVESVDGQFLNPDGTNKAFDAGKKIFSWMAVADAGTLNQVYRDNFDYPFVKFTAPTVAAGKVFRPTMNMDLSSDMLVNPKAELVVYGPLASRSNYRKVLSGINAVLF